MKDLDQSSEAYAVLSLLDANDTLREKNRRHKLTIEFPDGTVEDVQIGQELWRD